MPKFRKKPVVISAEQLTGAHTPDGVNYGYPVGENETHPLEGKHWVQTLEGPLVAKVGDWILTGVKGEKYPCKPDIFAATYDAVTEDADGGEVKLTYAVNRDAEGAPVFSDAERAAYNLDVPLSGSEMTSTMGPSAVLTIEERNARTIAVLNSMRRDVKNVADYVRSYVRRGDVTSADRSDLGEVCANLMLAFRHLEDASMRLGKAIQAADGGVSVYDRDTTVGA